MKWLEDVNGGTPLPSGSEYDSSLPPTVNEEAIPGDIRKPPETLPDSNECMPILSRSPLGEQNEEIPKGHMTWVECINILGDNSDESTSYIPIVKYGVGTREDECGSTYIASTKCLRDSSDNPIQAKPDKSGRKERIGKNINPPSSKSSPVYNLPPHSSSTPKFSAKPVWNPELPIQRRSISIHFREVKAPPPVSSATGENSATIGQLNVAETGGSSYNVANYKSRRN
uniref:Uncharacterized protein n=1 Tax=Timema shepardi TaxID=629360 RepID=A0A7R9FXN2_TIMSH|nr:unnamed protein product [Timema shepardi]